MRATSRSTASASLSADGSSPASSQQRLRRLRRHPALREQRRRRVHVSAHDEGSTAFETAYEVLGVQPTPGVVKLTLVPVHGYRGLCVTAEAVRAGQALMSVPWEHALMVEEGQEVLHWDMRLAQQLLDAVRQPGSAWHAYAPLLPRRVPSACLWPDAALAELQDDDTATAAARIREHFHEQMQIADVPAHRRGAVLWALSMVHSRSFLLTADANGCVAAGTRALVPMADQFNHAPPTEQQQQQGGDGQRTPWQVTRKADGGAAFTISASHDLGRGEEATISYGHDSNAELLVSYGFVPPRSRTDAVALYEEPQELIDDDRWVPRCSIKSRRLKESLLYDTMMAAAAGDSCPLGVRAQGASTQLLPVLRVLHCTDEQMGLLGQRRAVSAPLSASNEASVLTHVINRCEELLDAFPTSHADDERLMRELQDSGRRDHRLQLALTYRMERKQTLHEAVEHHLMALEALDPVDW